MRNILLISIAVVFLFFLVNANSGSQEKYDVSLKYEIERSVSKGLEYLAGTQKDNGSWSDYPGITGLALSAFLRAPENLKKDYQKNIISGFKYIMTNAQQDGGIYPNYEPQLKAYNTSICLMAMVDANSPAFGDQILNARNYLMSLQADESDGITKDSSTYGGIGYNSDERSDISNMQFALEAIRKSEEYAMLADKGQKLIPDSSGNQLPDEVNEALFWSKAITFLQRCQNYKKYNDYSWAGDDGGFVYYPGVSKAGGTTSYGGMTYSGVKSMIYAGLNKTDDRVKAAFNWIRSNYTVEENPELGQQGLYYYYYVMSKTLAVYGDNIIADTNKVNHDWRADLANILIKIQHEDGSWSNENGRWWENNPDLVTSYSIMALLEIMTF